MSVFMRLYVCVSPAGPLSEQLQVAGPLPQDDVRFYCYQIFEGLSYLHSRSYIHRDIKREWEWE